MNSELPLNPADFNSYYRFAPAALAIRECVRLKAVRELDLPAPILDVGCGDGLFARLAYPNKQAWGVDINPSEIQRAQVTQSYTTLICGNVCNIDLPKNYFASCIANCSLEHVPDIHGALANIRRSIRPGGKFVMIVPTPDWDQALMTSELLDKLGLRSLARAYGDVLNNMFAHIHLYDEKTWEGHLARAGFSVDRCDPIALRDASWAFDLFLYPSLLGFVTKKLTGHWVVAPGLRPLTADFARVAIDKVAATVKDRSHHPAEYLFLCTATGEEGA
jgi:SAM-dependent methyltransferase